MQHGYQVMAMQLGLKARLSLAVAAVAMASLGVSTLSASVVTYDSDPTAGFQTGSGAWDLNTTPNWTTDGGATNVNWTSNGDTAAFAVPGGAATVTVANTGGPVGAAGVQFTGIGGGNTLTLNGAALQLGAGGIISTETGQIVSISAPLALTVSQTWSSTTARTNGQGAAIRVAGDVSGTANLTVKGNGNGDPYGAGGSSSRVSVLLGGTNTFSGTTTVAGGASLWLDYSSNAGSKLDNSSALILSGGSVVLNGGSSIVEAVGSTTVHAGGNTIYAGAINGGGGAVNRLAAGALSHDLSGTLDVSNAVAGLVSTTTSYTATGGIIGAWATFGGNRWARAGASSGTDTNIVSYAGSTRTSSGTWLTTDNVNSNTTESGIGSKTVNSLLLSTASMNLTFAPGSTLTVTSGGILAASTGQSLAGGKIASGMATGELFVHAPNAFTVGSEIANNGATSTSLVKAGISSLTLTGTNSYSGRTYVNAGILQLDNGGSLASSNITITGGTLSAGTTGVGGAIYFNLSGDAADQINISSVGGLDLTNLNFNLVFNGMQTQSEYVLADKAVGSSYVSGTQFANTSGLGGAWYIDYDGTTAHPGDIVLVTVPEPAAFAVMAMAATGLLLRRRRAYA